MNFKEAYLHGRVWRTGSYVNIQPMEAETWLLKDPLMPTYVMLEGWYLNRLVKNKYII